MSRLALAAVSTGLAHLLTRLLWPQFQSTPFLLSFAATALSSWLGGRESGLAAVIFGVVWNVAFAPPLHGPPSFVLILGFTVISTAFCLIIARQQETRNALLASEQRLKTIIDAEPACVKLVSADGMLLEMNPAGLKMLEAADFSQLAGHPVIEVIHAEHRDRYLQAHDAASCGTPGRLEFQIVTLQGAQRWVDAHMVPFETGGSAAGARQSVLSVTSDITERKHLEEQFRQAQKMEAVGRLAGGIAHDFNNLLTVIGGMTQMALERLPEGPASADLRQAFQASESAAALTRQLLLFSRKQMTPMAAVDLNAVIANIKELLRRTIGEDIRVRIRLSPDLRRIRADASQLQQILMNLAVNSRDAMPRGGSIDIETDRMLLDGDAAQRLGVAPGQYVTLTFTDTGQGMDAPTRARVFEPFFTTKERGRGTGLGLSSVYGIIKALGGSISLTSEMGRGTTFKLYFPEMAAETTAAEAHPVSAPGPLTGTETVVLVEDDDRVRAFSTRVLRSAGYTVIEASAPSQVLSIVQRDQPIDALVTDIIMPEMDGCELARRVRTIRPETRVLYMSGYTDQVFEEHHVSLEEEPLLEKPFTAAELLRKMRDVLGPGAAATMQS